MFDLIRFAPSSPPPSSPGADPPSWADQLEAWATLGAAVIALAAAVATFWLLVHQIGEARRARAEARQERAEAAADRKLAADERREAERAQARTVLFENVDIRSGKRADGSPFDQVSGGVTNFGTGPVLDVSIHYRVEGRNHRLARVAVLAAGGALTADATVAGSAGELVAFFTDAAGLSWARHPGEQPVPASQSRPGPLDFVTDQAR
ncbi:hypothetical protein JIG36_45810 [Actinoplanes sp. LDG1-06]|uniref:Uncharacterized protein n=1 Tax=Paractinoplanes ovalisporus TaxID=2810368 RepID=A0ABS2ASJ6_9ACTN|nr:hypothetical protein [Actinoplanes ovalisporus]MBM2622842.1 hypothetical protein [Actinoplanes ovalisporus]